MSDVLMPISYRIDRQLRIIFTTAHGILTDDELLAHKHRLMRDPNFEAGMVELSDIRGVDQLAVTSEGVRRFVEQDRLDADRLGTYKLAIVAHQDVVFGMARMYETLTGENRPAVAVFRNMGEAKAWLAI